jgi:hypothetical protein
MEKSKYFESTYCSNVGEREDSSNNVSWCELTSQAKAVKTIQL